jgi:hypothetical protein
LIVGTHGRGIWILDNVNALQELTPDVRRSSHHLFTMEPGRQIRYRPEKGHNGNMIFRGANPPPGAIIDFWLLDDGEEPTLTVHDQEGTEVARVPVSVGPGVNRAIWNLRATDPGQGPNQPPMGPLVVPGTYTVRLLVGGEASENTLEVQEDPRIDVPGEVRRQWTADLTELGDLARRAATGRDRAREVLDRAEADTDLADAWRDKARDLLREWDELTSRARRLRGEVEGWVGPLTQDQRTQQAFYLEMLETLGHEVDVLEVQIGGSGPTERGP